MDGFKRLNADLSHFSCGSSRHGVAAAVGTYRRAVAKAQYRISSTIASGGMYNLLLADAGTLLSRKQKSPGCWPLLKPHGRC